MKESSGMINILSIASIVLGLVTMYRSLSLNIQTFGIEFIIYMLAGFSLVMGLLVLTREERRK
jgi:general stress protein CsbA